MFLSPKNMGFHLDFPKNTDSHLEFPKNTGFHLEFPKNTDFHLEFPIKIWEKNFFGDWGDIIETAESRIGN